VKSQFGGDRDVQRRYPLRTIKEAAAWGWMVTVIAMLLTGCVRNPGDTQNLDRRSDTVKVRSREETLARQSMQRQIIRIRLYHHVEYVPLPDLARAMGYHGAWVNHGTAYGIGDHDVVWSFRIGQSEVRKAGTKLTMPAPAVFDEGLLYVPVQGLQHLFGGEATINGDSANLTVVPRPLMNETGADGTRLPFADAPRTRSSSAADRKTDSLITYAQRYLGTRYEFGAAPYAAGGTFDCSSFTQHVMQHVDAKLPRTATEQSQLGKPVSRESLKPGDLLFFHVPGRNKSQAAVGHVGIYMDGGRMIHASPQPHDGVQVSDLRGAYWMRNFLYAKRVL
jgi:hypothetical protein